MDPEYRSIEKKEKPYYFNGVLPELCDNAAVFNKTVAPNLEQVLLGINATFFAYGITGSGKTHTIFGENSDPGICLRCGIYIKT
jgi:kinesin family protein 18/19